MASKQPTRKVVAATGGGLGGGVVATFVNWLIGAYVFGHSTDTATALAAVPSPIAVLVLAVVPGVAAYASGWVVAEAPRPPLKRGGAGRG